MQFWNDRAVAGGDIIADHTVRMILTARTHTSCCHFIWRARGCISVCVAAPPPRTHDKQGILNRSWRFGKGHWWWIYCSIAILHPSIPSCDPDIDRSPSPLRWQRMSYRQCDRKYFPVAHIFGPVGERFDCQIAMMIFSQISVSLSNRTVKSQKININLPLGQSKQLCLDQVTVSQNLTVSLLFN